MKIYFTALFLFVITHCFAQDGTLTLDLSNNVNKTYSQTITPQTVKAILLSNVLILHGYSVSIQLQHIGQVPLVIPGNPPSVMNLRSPCPGLTSAIDKLEKETEENLIPTDLSGLQAELVKADPATCAAEIANANKDIKLTFTTYPLTGRQILVGKGDKLEIIVTRDDKHKWTFDFETENINHFTVYYGFTYVPDILTHFPNYYVKANGNNTYTITQMNGNEKNVFQNLSPSVLFTYRFFKNPDAIAKFGISGGFQYNTQVLGALFGPSLVIADNISINTGIAFLQKYKLKGQYSEGEIINDNLDFSQLHNQIWTYDIFFSIGFNIPSLFSKSSSKTDESAKSGN